MEHFITTNPGFMLWMLGGIFTLIGILLSLLFNSYATKDKKRDEVLEALRDTINNVNNSLLHVADQMREFLHGIDTRLSVLEREHRIYTNNSEVPCSYSISKKS
jgi:hypothetical protein